MSLRNHGACISQVSEAGSGEASTGLRSREGIILGASDALRTCCWSFVLVIVVFTRGYMPNESRPVI